MASKTLSGQQKRAARIKRGEDPKGPPKKVAPSKSAPVSVAGVDIPTESELVPTKGKLKKTAGSNKRKMIIALVVLGIVIMIVGGFFAISAIGSKGATDAATKFIQNGPPPQSHLMPAGSTGGQFIPIKD